MAPWARHPLHSAANLFHVQSRLGHASPGHASPGPRSGSSSGSSSGSGSGSGSGSSNGSGSGARLYRVAWIGGCVLFDSAKLRDCGGFGFWAALPPGHCGEDVLAQLRVMERHGGCGILPSGAYHMELPTTVTTRDVDAPYALLGGAAAVTEDWKPDER